MPCSITRVGVAAAVPEQVVEVGDVDEREVVAVGRRVAHVGDPALRRVVLDVDGGQVAAGRGPSQSRGQVLELVRALQDDDVDVARRAAARA